MALLSAYNQFVRKDLLRCGVLSKTTALAGTEIHYYEAPGDPSVFPTVLVHGFGDSANTWYQVIGPLARALGRVYALDLPGAGFSKVPPGQDHPTLVDCGLALTRFLDEVVRDPCLLVGQSLGGALVLRVASVHAHPLAGVAAIAPAGAPFTTEQMADLRAAFAVPDRAAGRALLGRIFTAVPWTLKLVERDLRALWRSPPVKKLLESMTQDDYLRPEELSAIDAPALVLWGTEERLLPQAFLDYYRAHLPNARVEVVRGWGHAPQMERPGELLHRLVDFGRTLSVPAEAAPGARRVLG